MTRFLFDKIAIIGTGLIGGSLALACKEKRITEHISGCNSNPNSLQKSLNLGIIDSGSTNIADVIADADLIIIATPLHSYKIIAQNINKYAKKNVIISDCGSVKDKPSIDIINELEPDRIKYFIPAHPIAGTEKSGPEAAFSQLYKGKKTLISPFEFSDKKAVDLIQQLWRNIGSDIEIISSDIHDVIYAKTSHNVQIISYIFITSLTETIPTYFNANNYDSNVNNKLNNQQFMAFTRLSGSNPMMWRDICQYNSQNIITALTFFAGNIDKINQLIKSKNIKEITTVIEIAKNRYHQLFYNRSEINQSNNYHKNQHQHDNNSDNSSDDINCNLNIWQNITPFIIATAIIMDIKKIEHNYLSGAGMRSLVEPINYNITSDNLITNSALNNKIYDILDIIKYQTELIIDYLQKHQYDEIYQYFIMSQKSYNNL